MFQLLYEQSSIDKDSNSPGPIYLPAPGVTKTGRQATPASHITSRPKEYGWLFY